MALNLSDFPSSPECGGKQWSVSDQDELATLVALVLIGRAKHAENVLTGTHRTTTTVPDALKAQLRLQLQTAAGPLTYHRDGLLFEIISWIAARVSAASDEVISTPHLKSTQQGLDTIKIKLDPVAHTLNGVVIYEQKCSEHARNEFRNKVIPAFRDWKEHKRDNQLVQAVVALVERFNLSDEQHQRLYDRLVQLHPLSFQAALTVTPTPFDTQRCIALFSGYSEVTPNIADRLGDTFPLVQIRDWFSAFAQNVLDKIEASDV
jgi:hypothetical protein